MSGSRFVEAVDAIYGTTHAPSLWPSALQKIADVFQDEGAVLEYEATDGAVYQIVSDQQRASHESLHTALAIPLSVKGVTTGPSSPVTFKTHLLPQPLTPRWLAGSQSLPGGSANGPTGRTALVAPERTSSDVGLFLRQHSDRTHYSTAEKAIYRDLCRHASKAFHLSNRLHAAEAAADGLKLALDTLGVAAIVLDAVKRVTFTNSPARGLLGEGLSIVDQRLTILDASEGAAFEGAVDEILANGPGVRYAGTRPILLTRNVQRPLAVYILPLAEDSSPAQDFLNHTRILILLMDPGTNASPDPALVQTLLGVTPGEAKIAAIVSKGASLRQAAEQLGIAEETARTVLKRVFAKSGISRQSELAALLSRLVPR